MARRIEKAKEDIARDMENARRVMRRMPEMNLGTEHYPGAVLNGLYEMFRTSGLPVVQLALIDRKSTPGEWYRMVGDNSALLALVLAKKVGDVKNGIRKLKESGFPVTLPEGYFELGFKPSSGLVSNIADVLCRDIDAEMVSTLGFVWYVSILMDFERVQTEWCRAHIWGNLKDQRIASLEEDLLMVADKLNSDICVDFDGDRVPVLLWHQIIRPPW